MTFPRNRIRGFDIDIRYARDFEKAEAALTHILNCALEGLTVSG